MNTENTYAAADNHDNLSFGHMAENTRHAQQMGQKWCNIKGAHRQLINQNTSVACVTSTHPLQPTPGLHTATL